MKTMETKKRKHMSQRLRQFARANEAVSALEYAVLVGVIVVGVAAALALLEDDLTTAITNIGDAVATIDSTDPDLDQ